MEQLSILAPIWTTRAIAEAAVASRRLRDEPVISGDRELHGVQKPAPQMV
jgi:hypothetical protein